MVRRAHFTLGSHVQSLKKIKNFAQDGVVGLRGITQALLFSPIFQGSYFLSIKARWGWGIIYSLIFEKTTHPDPSPPPIPDSYIAWIHTLLPHILYSSIQKK